MLQLADVLHSRGFGVTIFHAAFDGAPDPARRRPAAGYRFVPVGGAGVPAGDLLPSGSDADFAGALLRINERLQAPFQDVLRGVLAEEGEEEDAPACLVLDSNLRGMQEVADRLGVPTLVLRTGGAACLVAYMAFPALCDKGLLPPPAPADHQSKLDMPLDELPPLRLRDMLFSATTAHATMSTCVERIVEASRCSSGLILNTFSDLEASELQRITADDGDGGGGVPPRRASSPTRLLPDAVDDGGRYASLSTREKPRFATLVTATATLVMSRRRERKAAHREGAGVGEAAAASPDLRLREAAAACSCLLCGAAREKPSLGAFVAQGRCIVSELSI